MRKKYAVRVSLEPVITNRESDDVDDDLRRMASWLMRGDGYRPLLETEYITERIDEEWTPGPIMIRTMEIWGEQIA